LKKKETKNSLDDCKEDTIKDQIEKIKTLKSKVKGIKKPRFKQISSANELKEREPILFKKNNSLDIPETP
jgi:hypothetical protein